MAKLMPSTCHTCKRLREEHGPEARCTMHETSTSLRLEKEPRREVINHDGPFLAALCGYNPEAEVPMFDDDGKRYYGETPAGYKTRKPPREREPIQTILRREREAADEARWQANRLAFAGSRR